MPCYDPPDRHEQAESARRYKESITGPLHEEIDTLKSELAEREAMLCAIIRMLKDSALALMDEKGRFQHANLDSLYDAVDWEEAGVKRSDLISWWIEHQRRDEERLAREAAELEAKRQKALAKLTHEERILLGFPGKVV